MKNAFFFHLYLFILSGALFSCVTPKPGDESSASSESVSSVERTSSSSSAGAYTVMPMGGYTALTSDVDGLLNYQSVEINWSEFDKQQSLNDLRHWLDSTPDRLPKGAYGVDGWINDQQTVARVRELYKPNADWKATVEADRELFLRAMAKIKHDMVLGKDKNIYVEPVIWTVEHVQRVKYGYPEKGVN